MLKNKFLRVLRNLLFVPRCAACRERLSALYPEGATTSEMLSSDCLCENCKSAWDIAKARPCPECKLEASRCLCSPKRLSKYSEGRAGLVDALPKLVFYDPNTPSTQARVIYSAKRIYDRRYFEFLADELSPSLCRLLSLERIAPEDCVFTFVPRSKRALAENGFDQGRELCHELSRVCGGMYARLLLRSGGEEQKMLGVADRRKNILKSVRASKRASATVKDRVVVLVDDICTTGASLGISAEILSLLGARRVIFVCIAVSK